MISIFGVKGASLGRSIFFTLFLGVPIFSTAQTAEDLLKQRMNFWLQNAPLCNGYPSKLYEDGKGCSDGDMNLFSGLLCAAGVKDSQGKLIGCESVAAAQDQEGRWFRSPRHRLDPKIDAEEHKANIASFSPDMALGAQLYLVTTRNKSRGDLWLKWLDEHRPCWGASEPDCKIDIEIPPILSIHKINARGLPRFCTDEPGPPQPEDTDLDKKLRELRIDPRCSMRPGDLAVLAKTRAALQIYKFHPEDGAACAEPAASTFEDAKARFDKLERLLNLTRLENIETIIDGGLPYMLRLTCAEAPTWTRLNAEFNQKGYSEHLVAVNILQLRRMGLDNALLKESAKRLAAKEPENPFFLFLNEGKTEPVLSKILQYCPKDAAEAVTSKKSQWLWEREKSDKDWKGTSSLWDCLFIGHLWLQGS